MRFSSDDILIDRVVNNETVFSNAIQLDYLFGYSVWAAWAGSTIAGSILLQASLDGSNWNDIANTTVTITGASNNLWNISDAFYKYFRIKVISDDANAITVNSKYYAKGV